MKDWWGKQAAIFAALAFVGSLFLLGAGAAWIQDIGLARQTVHASPEATCTGDQQECAEKDLPAQVRAARAGEAMVDIAVWQLIVSAVALLGIVGLFWNIVQGHAALDRAREANEIARKSSERQLRAYVYAEDVQVRDYEPGKHPIVSVVFRNRGQTPARDFYARATVKDGNDPDQKVFFGRMPRNKIMDLPPGGEHRARFRFLFPLTQAEYDRALRTRVTFRYSGIIRYNDYTGRRRRTLFSRQLYMPYLEDGKADLSVAPRSNRSS